jgi:hypothetical protein
MTNHEHLGESDPVHPDPPYNLLSHRTKLIAELIALGDVDDPSIFDDITGDLSTLPPELREFVLKSLQEALQEQDQANNGTPLPPDTPQ